MITLHDTDWDWIRPDQAQNIEQTSKVLGGRPRIAGTRVSVAQILDWVRRFGQAGAVAQFQACQPSLSEEEAGAAIDAALAFSAAVLDRVLPASLARERPDWADNVRGWNDH